MTLSAQRKTQLHKYLQSVYNRQVGGAVAVFDIGTKAARVLVGPCEVPVGEWGRGDFFNDAVVANLGLDLKPGAELTVEGNAALTDVIDFMRDYASALAFEGVAANALHAVGTAVFRWIANRDEVLRTFAERTGVRLVVLPPEEESRLSLAAIAATYRFGLPRDVASFEALVLLDQGGGSLEISFSTPDGAQRGFASLDRLGTVFLRDRFMSAGDDDIDDRLTRLRREIGERLDGWPGFPELAGKRLLAYGMGTALAACLPRMHNFFMHNFALGRVAIEARYADVVANVRAKRGGALAEADREPDETDNELTVLYGIPVFLMLMERMGLAELRFAGYGLRYGAYLRLYRDRQPLTSL